MNSENTGQASSTPTAITQTDVQTETVLQKPEGWFVRGGGVLLQICTASVIASIGLHVGNIPIVIGSMLLSPIGGACLDIGKKSARNIHSLYIRYTTGDKDLLAKVLNVNTALPLVLRIAAFTLIPIGFGVGFGAFLPPRYEKTGADDSEEMDEASYERANSEILGRSVLYGDGIKNLLGGLVIAVAAGLMLSIGDVNAVVGIGIATALLPPLVSCGMLLGTSLRKDASFKKFLRRHSVGALATFGVNFFAILLASLGVYMLMMSGSDAKGSMDIKAIRDAFQKRITYYVNLIQKIE